MIVICGNLGSADRNENLATSIAQRTAAAGAAVEIVGIVPDGSDGDATLIGMAADGVGHAAILRTAERPLERADIELALRYLPEIRVIIAVDLPPDLLTAIVEGAGFTGATVIAVVPAREPDPVKDAVSDATIVVMAPVTDPDGTFAGFVGAFAARLDGGQVAADAWADTLFSLAVDVVSPGRLGEAPRAAQ